MLHCLRRKGNKRSYHVESTTTKDSSKQSTSPSDDPPTKGIKQTSLNKDGPAAAENGTVSTHFKNSNKESSLCTADKSFQHKHQQEGDQALICFKIL